MEGEQGGGGSRIKVVVISGPTAVGKSAIAETLAQKEKLDAELVSADSVQVYRGMDIGSNKPTAEERASVRYHLLDVVEPTEEYNAADFTAHARSVIGDISSRGKLPIVVGGTGFYLQWLVFGRPGAPKPTEEAEEKARSAILACEGSWEEAANRFRSLDERYFDGLHGNDWLRLQRMLEVSYTTGKPISSFERPQGKSLAVDQVSHALSCTDLDFRCFFLYRSRLEIFRDIDLRCELMLQSGFLEEVSSLVASGKLRMGTGPAVENEDEDGGGADRKDLDRELEAFIKDFQSVSRQFVRRQLTWFRSDPVFRWVQAADRAKAVEELEEAIGKEEQEFLRMYDEEEERRKQEEARQSESSKEEQKLLKQYQSQLTIYKDEGSRSSLLDSILEMDVVKGE
ncbi:hypothetical protein GUITHDRAFT_139595 [Guillardia theta CCMP2712]|uniref:tRNA dimethylallyltransferase n=1 Tax=Guillardia theta (strain CCMP2712) TaxID=905079 RepID=L1J8K3_GUITC|nr:hypothetical protein GUITHDRAFT_139595 [Guillardia theta CCMP2712]EKX44667.1 hypothetical protein GUITHDRAFT_139595 [Guillardia theta CCMP2712]|eukprot:XP_005831647.1 hypothetical protein GUITHDRAFT_139595 [Guillardia theta CCMP2712]